MNSNKEIKKRGRGKKRKGKKGKRKETSKSKALTNEKENGSGEMFCSYTSVLLAISIHHFSGKLTRQLDS